MQCSRDIFLRLARSRIRPPLLCLLTFRLPLLAHTAFASSPSPLPLLLLDIVTSGGIRTRAWRRVFKRHRSISSGGVARQRGRFRSVVCLIAGGGCPIQPPVNKLPTIPPRPRLCPVLVFATILDQIGVWRRRLGVVVAVAQIQGVGGEGGGGGFDLLSASTREAAEQSGRDDWCRFPHHAATSASVGEWYCCPFRQRRTTAGGTPISARVPRPVQTACVGPQQLLAQTGAWTAW